MLSIIKAIPNYPNLELQVVAAGGALLPKYGSTVKSLENITTIDRHIPYLVEGENLIGMAKSAGLAALDFSTAYYELNPDIAIIIADRYECLPMAMAATYLNIPVAHVEGGEVTGSVDESIRHAITKLAQIHFPATKDAAERIIRMGEDPASVYPVGATSLDVIKACDLRDLGQIQKLQAVMGVGSVVDLSKPYIVVIQHPVTTEYELNRRHVEQTLCAVHEGGYRGIWIWPNMDAGSDGVSAGIRSFRERENNDRIHFFKGLPIEHFAPLLANTACIVGNSSSGIREAAFLGTPCVNVGTRQHGRTRTPNVLDVPCEKGAIVNAIGCQLVHGRYQPDHTYGDGNAGLRTLEALSSCNVNLQKRIMY